MTICLSKRVKATDMYRVNSSIKIQFQIMVESCRQGGYKKIRGNYRPQRSCGQGNVFTGVCLSTGGRVSASVHAVMPYPPRPGTHHPPGPGRPPRTRHTPPPPRSGRPPLGPGRPPPTRQTPPGPGRPPPPGSRLQHAYGLRAAGTHPTGMHSCSLLSFCRSRATLERNLVLFQFYHS